MPRAKVVENKRVVRLDKAQLQAMFQEAIKSGMLGNLVRPSSGIKQPRKALIKVHKVSPATKEKKKVAKKKKADSDDETESTLRKKLKALALKKQKKSKKATEEKDEEEEDESAEDAAKTCVAEEKHRARPGTRMRRLRRKLLWHLADNATRVSPIVPRAVMRRIIEAMYPEMRLSEDAVALVCSSLLTLIPRIQRAVAMTRKMNPGAENDPKAKTPPVRRATLEQCIMRG